MKKLFFALAILISVVGKAQLQLPYSIKVVTSDPLDWKLGPWSSTTAAKTNVPLSLRKGGLTVYITSCHCEYWWLDSDLSDGGLIIKQSAGGLQQGNNTLTDDLTLDGLTNGKAVNLATNALEFFSAGVLDFQMNDDLAGNSYNRLFSGHEGILVGSDSGTPGQRGVSLYTGVSGDQLALFINQSGAMSFGNSIDFGSSGQVPTSSGIGAPLIWQDIPNELPAQGGNSGKFLKTDGTSPSWDTPSGGGGGLTSITDDPFHYPANGNTNDQFGGRTSGNLKSIFNAYTLPVVTGLNNRLVIDGNSNGDGAALSDTTKRYGTVAASILGGTAAGYTYKNFAVAGQTTVQMNTDAVSQIDGSYVAGKSKNYLAAFEVENDAAINTGSSTATLYSAISSYWSGRKATGYYVIGMTSPLRSSYTASAQDLTINNRIETVNASIRSGTSDYNTLIDITLIPRLSNVRSRVGFFNDNLHFNVSGQADLADRVVSKIRADQSQQDYTPPNFMSWNGNTPDRSMIAGSLNNQPFGFITNGKVRGEFESFGTFNVNAHVVASSDIPFGTRNQAIGVFINPGLKAAANEDIMSALTIQPEYFDPVSFTGTVSDNLTINKQLTSTTHANLMRINSNGQITHTPLFTPTGANDYAVAFNGSITGLSSGTYIENNFGAVFDYAANNTGYINTRFAQTINLNSKTNTRSTIVDIELPSNATANDIALKLVVPEGIGVDLSSHAGTGTAINVVSSSSGTGNAMIMTDAAAIPGVWAKTTGTAQIGRFITQSTSNASGLLDMFAFERSNGSQVAGTGIANYVQLKSDAPNNVRALQEDYYWLSNVDGAENAAFRWKAVVAGTLTEGMRLEGKNLIVAGTVTATNGTLTVQTAQAGGRNLTALDNGSIITTSNTSPITITIVAGLPLGFHCTIIQGSTGAVLVNPDTGVTGFGSGTTASAGDAVDVSHFGTSGENYKLKLY